MNQPLNNLCAIVLAGGKSQRTSPENKLLLPFRGKTIIQTVLDEIELLNFAEILVVTGFEQYKIRKALKDYSVQYVSNPDYKQGMATSIRAGVLKAKSDTDGCMIFLGDMPWIEEKALRSQIQSFYTNPESAIVVPVFEKRRGNPVIFAKKYQNKLLELAGDSGARRVVEKFENQVIEAAVPNEQQLNDVDSWEDYNNSDY